MDGSLDNVSDVSCCFCNREIYVNDVDPCDIQIATNWNSPSKRQRDQVFWCHLECFRDKMHQEVKDYLVIDILSSEKE